MAVGTTTFRAGASAAEVATSLSSAGLELRPADAVTVVVLDTFDGRLAAAGMRLTASRHTDSDSGPVTITLSETDGVDAVASVDRVPRVAADVPGGPLRQRLARKLDVRVLLPLLTMSTTRQTATLRNADGKITAVVTVVDGATAPDGTHTSAVYVDLVELVGYEGAATGIRDALIALGVDESPVGAVEATAAAWGIDLGGTVIDPGVPLDRETPTIDAVRAVLANLRDAIVANVPGTIDDVDPEFLHDLRVGVRRTRAVLANAKKVLPPDVLDWGRADFAWMGEITGPARDLDVYQIEWETYVAGLPTGAVTDLEAVREVLDAERLGAHAVLSSELRDGRASSLLARWSEWLDEPIRSQAVPDGAAAPIGRFVAKRIRRAHRTMIDRGRAITPASPGTDLHELRKDAKKLRYLVECFGGLYDPAARKPFVQRLKALQDNLGEHQDAEVHADQLGAVAAASAGRLPVATVVAAGRLIERMEQRGAGARHEFADRFADFDSAATRKALKALLATGHSKRARP